MTPTRPMAGRPRQRGMTVIELMITLAVIGLLAVVGYMGLRRVRQSDLRADTTKVAATLRNAHLMAMQTGIHHRVVFDLDKHTYSIQACEGQVRLARSDKEPTPDEDAEERAARMLERLKQGSIDSTMQAEVVGASTPEEAAKLAQALAGNSVGTARCGPPKRANGKVDLRGEARTMRKGLEIAKVYVQHLEDPVTEGVVTINFFPLGYAEKAVVVVSDSDGDSAYTLLVHGLTGRVEFRSGEIEDADEHMMRNAAGEKVDDRE